MKLPGFKPVMISILVITLFCLFFMALKIINLQDKSESNLNRIQMLEEQITNLEGKRLDLYVQLSSDEFVRTWQSLATVRNNFLALGLGYHICPGDIAPEAEYEENP